MQRRRGRGCCGGRTGKIRDGWKQMRVSGGRKMEGEKKIGWEMRDCMEPKSQPAGPACCLRDCKLSLRMQTDKQDRHHLPILPSATETVTHAAASSPLLSLSFAPFWPCICVNMNSLIYFPSLPPLPTFSVFGSLFRWWNESAGSMLSPLIVQWFVASP